MLRQWLLGSSNREDAPQGGEGQESGTRALGSSLLDGPWPDQQSEADQTQQCVP